MLGEAERERELFDEHSAGRDAVYEDVIGAVVKWKAASAP